MNKFDIVTPEWIRGQLKEKGISQIELSEGVNTSPTHLNHWLSGFRKPTASAKAAIYYFFERH